MTVDTRTMRKRKKKQLALKLIAAGFVGLLLLRLDVIGFFRQDGHSQKNHKGDDRSISKTEGKNLLREIMEKEWKDEQISCDIPHLKNNIRLQLDDEPACVRSPPLKSSCRLARYLFGSPSTNNVEAACKHQPSREFCRMTGLAGSLKPSCNMSQCSSRDTFALGTINVDIGRLTWTTLNSNEKLEHAIQDLMSHENVGYCYVDCVDGEDFANIEENMPAYEFYELEDISSNPQLLNLPPVINNNMNIKLESQKRNHFNFNFVFIDSVSRHHFFRSLPKSVKVLESLLNKYSTYDFHSAESAVLDFEMVQAVRSRTFETLQALFSGSINPFEKPFGVLEMPRAALKTEALLKPLQKLGYKTLWLEDLCPFWEWGISKDLRVYSKEYDKDQIWKIMKSSLENASIDSLGNTFASCKILHANNVPDPFHGPDQVCYNSRHHHEYLLEYLKMYQSTVHSNSQPFFTFLETNVGHDDTGKRIQFFDSALAEYLEFTKTLKNTLTVVFSDHGNAYGKYMSESQEGRIELYQPFLFMIIPDNVKQFIGHSKMASLIKNQRRLVSVLDLHYTFSYLVESLSAKAKSSQTGSQKESDSNVMHLSSVSNFNKQFNVTKYGLLSDISESRTCSLVPRIMPNLCLCAGYGTSVENYGFHYILALHAVGEINNEIQRQRYKGSNSRGGFGRCYRLKVGSIKNIQESSKDALSRTIKMDLYVTTTGQSRPEIFFITVNKKRGDHRTFDLGSFERITPYSKFSMCLDEGVDLNMCVCDTQRFNISQNVSVSGNEEIRGKNKSAELSLAESILYSDLAVKKTEIQVNDTQYLYIFSQSGKLGVLFEAVSICDVSVQVTLTLSTVNMILSSSEKTLSVIMRPGDVTYLLSGVAMDTEQEFTWQMSVQHQVLL